MPRRPNNTADPDTPKQRAKPNTNSYKTYIYQVLKQVHPKIGISTNAMEVLNDFTLNLFQRINTEAKKLNSLRKRSIITSRDIQSAVKLIFKGQLAAFAVSEGYRSVQTYTKVMMKSGPRYFRGYKFSRADLDFKVDDPDAAEEAEDQNNLNQSNDGRRRKWTPKKHSTSCGLVFSILRVKRHMKRDKGQKRLSALAPVYLAAVLEYVMLEILEISGDAAIENHKKRITPRFLTLGIHNDEELWDLFGLTSILPQGGVVPSILPELIPEKKTKTKVLTVDGVEDDEDKGKSQRGKKRKEPEDEEDVTEEVEPAKKSARKRNKVNHNQVRPRGTRPVRAGSR